MSKLNNVAENFGLRFHTDVTIKKLNKNRLNDLTEEEINKELTSLLQYVCGDDRTVEVWNEYIIKIKHIFDKKK